VGGSVMGGHLQGWSVRPERRGSRCWHGGCERGVKVNALCARERAVHAPMRCGLQVPIYATPAVSLRGGESPTSHSRGSSGPAAARVADAAPTSELPTAAAASPPAAGPMPSVDGSVASLERLRVWRPAGAAGSAGSGGVHLDLAAYKRGRLAQCSVHVGGLFFHLRAGSCREEGRSDSEGRRPCGEAAAADVAAAAAPSVTVLMPCFNAAAFITRAVRSVLDQAQVREAVNPRRIERRARR